MKFHWDVDLVGRPEDQAARELMQTVLAEFPKQTLSGPRTKTLPPKPYYPSLLTVFISYRRTDNASGVVNKLAEAIATRLPGVRVFLDVVDTGDNDVDLATRLVRAIGNAPTTLIVIGPQWPGLRDDGSARIQDENDYVRLEVDHALRQSDAPFLVLLDDTPGAARGHPARRGPAPDPPAQIEATCRPYRRRY